MRDPGLNLLFVCSRNRWRSPTAERIYARSERYAVRSRGLSQSAVRRLSAEDVAWADVVFVMESEHKRRLVGQFREVLEDREVIVLDIPDEYRFMDPELVELITSAVDGALERD